MNMEEKEYKIINNGQGGIKVLLVAPVYPAISRFGLPPYNIAYLAGYLRKNNQDVNLKTLNAEEYTTEELNEILASAEYDVLGIGGMITTYSFCKHVLDTSLKYRPEAKRVIGGPITYASIEILFEHLPIDCAVLGEGEKTFSHLLDTWRTNGKIEDVEGLSYRQNKGDILLTAPRNPINLQEEDLMPDWEVIDIEKYVKWNPLAMYLDSDDPGNMRQFSMFLGRGCPCKCNYCGSPLGRFRKRKIDNIIKEIIYLKERYDINVLYFMSDNFFGNKQDIKIFCERLLDLKSGIRWICNLRVDFGDAEIFRIMKMAGCGHITFGLESGNDKILERMNKKTTVLQNREAMALAREAGIYPAGSVMFGYLDEEIDDIKKTVDMMVEGNHLPSSLSVVTAFPGTVLYDQAVSRGLIKDHYGYILNLKGDIGLENKPMLNLSKISNEIFWESMVTEKRRLYTTHYLNNRALFCGRYWNGNRVSLILKCPYCENLHNYRMSGQFIFLGEQYCCRKCRRLLWIDPYSLPENKRYHEQVTEFITRVNRGNASVAIYSAGLSIRYVFLLDIWGIDFQRVTGVISDSQDVSLVDRSIYGIKCYRLNELRNLSPEYILITDTNSDRNIYNYFLNKGFKKDHLQTLVPVSSILSRMNYLMRQVFYTDLKTLKKILKSKILDKLSIDNFTEKAGENGI